MAGGFSFPPPPPPPPKAAAPDQSYGSNNQNSGRGGRGRGNFRGRGGQQFGSRGAFSQQNGQRNTSHQGPQAYQRNNPSNQYGNAGYGVQQQGTTVKNNPAFPEASPTPYQQPSMYPVGRFVNPAFNSNRYQDHAVNAYTTYNPASSPQVAAGAEPDVLNGQVGQKRKHEDGTGGIPSGSWKQSQGGSRPTFYHPMKKNNNNNNNVPKVQAAPAVPSFGGPLPVPLKPQAFASSPKTSSSTQRKKNLLGLVPQGAEPEESDEEEDVDEEAVYASSSGEPLSFELNGEVCTLSSPAEIKAWIEERRKLWPSKLRIEEKNREVRARMEERKRIQEEAQAAAAASTSLRQHSDSSRQQQKQRKKTRDAQASGSHLERTKKELEKQMKKVEQLQTLLAQNGKRPEKLGVTQSQADDFPQGEDTDSFGMDHEQAAPHAFEDEDKVPVPFASGPGLSESHTSSSEPDSESATDSDSSSESDSDGAPEEQTSRLQKPLRVPPPNEERRICRFFATTGHCKLGSRCRFKHDLPGQPPQQVQRVTPSTQRKSLYQRLVEQEKEEENRLALQAIKYLGSVGFFSKR